MHIVVAMKPCDGTFAGNALKHGVAGLNIDASRIKGDEPQSRHVPASEARGHALEGSVDGSLRQAWDYDGSKGRFPANVILDRDAALLAGPARKSFLVVGDTPVTAKDISQSNIRQVIPPHVCTLSDDIKTFTVHPAQSGPEKPVEGKVEWQADGTLLPNSKFVKALIRRGFLTKDATSAAPAPTPIVKLDAHPVTRYLPHMDFDGPEFAALLHDIEVSGQKEPLVLYEGRILDGRHRYEVCRRLGIEPKMAPDEFKGNEHEALAYALSVKDKRGMITKSQKAVMALRLLRDNRISETVEKARRRKIAATLRQGKKRRMWEEHSRNLTADEKTARARAIAADMLGINDRYVGYADQLARKSPDLLDAVFQGRISLLKAMRSLNPERPTDPAGLRELRNVSRSLRSIHRKLSGHPQVLGLVEKLGHEVAALVGSAGAQHDDPEPTERGW